MSFSPGEFMDKRGARLHWEGHADKIILEGPGVYIILNLENASKASEQLALLVEMLENEGL
jgi:hypothetical protein